MCCPPLPRSSSSVRELSFPGGPSIAVTAGGALTSILSSPNGLVQFIKHQEQMNMAVAGSVIGRSMPMQLLRERAAFSQVNRAATAAR